MTAGGAAEPGRPHAGAGPERGDVPDARAVLRAAGRRFARRIEPGNRAFSIPVQADRAVENFVLPGARVDVIGVFEQPDGSFAPERMLENVVIMAVDGLDSIGAIEAENAISFNTVTLQAPAEATEAFLARMQQVSGDLSLVLRNPCEVAADCEAPVQDAPDDTAAADRRRARLKERGPTNDQGHRATAHLRCLRQPQAILPLDRAFFEVGGDTVRRGAPGYIHLAGSGVEPRHAQLVQGDGGWSVLPLTPAGLRIGRRDVRRARRRRCAAGTRSGWATPAADPGRDLSGVGPGGQFRTDRHRSHDVPGAARLRKTAGATCFRARMASARCCCRPSLTGFCRWNWTWPASPR